MSKQLANKNAQGAEEAIFGHVEILLAGHKDQQEVQNKLAACEQLLKVLTTSASGAYNLTYTAASTMTDMKTLANGDEFDAGDIQFFVVSELRNLIKTNLKDGFAKTKATAQLEIIFPKKK